MRDYLKLPTILSLMSLSLIFVTPAQAQRSAPCSNDNQEQPSQARREITNEEYGLRFEIPANYRTELRRESRSAFQRLSIFVRNPTDVAFLDCATRNRMIGAGHQVSDVIVSIEPRPRHIRNVRNILQDAAESGGISRDIIDPNFTTISGQDAVIYTVQSNPRRGITSRSRFAALIHPNQQSLVTIYAGDYGFSINAIDLEVMDIIMSSFRIDRN